MQTLDEYNIKYSQVHSITTDNGSNVVRMVNLFGQVENDELFADDDCVLNDLFFDDNADDSNNNASDNEDDNGEVGAADEVQSSLDQSKYSK